VIGGKHQAELELKKFEDAQDSSDRHEGWRYLIDLWKIERPVQMRGSKK
jgi:hypothetical protein